MLADKYKGDPVLIEYNARLGDPEAQVVLPLLVESSLEGYVDDKDQNESRGIKLNVAKLFLDAARGELRGDKLINVVQQSGRVALSVCLAAEGYPEKTRKGDVVYGALQRSRDLIIHHGGTEYREDEGNRIFTAGGRVLHVTGLENTIQGVAKLVFDTIADDSGPRFEGMQYRKDIGRRAMEALAA